MLTLDVLDGQEGVPLRVCLDRLEIAFWGSKYQYFVRKSLFG